MTLPWNIIKGYSSSFTIKKISFRFCYFFMKLCCFQNAEILSTCIISALHLVLPSFFVSDDMTKGDKGLHWLFNYHRLSPWHWASMCLVYCMLPWSGEQSLSDSYKGKANTAFFFIVTVVFTNITTQSSFWSKYFSRWWILIFNLWKPFMQSAVLPKFINFPRLYRQSVNSKTFPGLKKVFKTQEMVFDTFKTIQNPI